MTQLAITPILKNEIYTLVNPIGHNGTPFKKLKIENPRFWYVFDYNNGLNKCVHKQRFKVEKWKMFFFVIFGLIL